MKVMLVNCLGITVHERKVLSINKRCLIYQDGKTRCVDMTRPVALPLKYKRRLQKLQKEMRELARLAIPKKVLAARLNPRRIRQ